MVAISLLRVPLVQSQRFGHLDDVAALSAPERRPRSLGQSDFAANISLQEAPRHGDEACGKGRSTSNRTRKHPWWIVSGCFARDECGQAAGGHLGALLQLS
jgi:hypothetical protein